MKVAVNDEAGKTPADEGWVPTYQIPTSIQWYTRSADTFADNYHYVNSKDVPTAGSSLSIQFEAK